MNYLYDISVIVVSILVGFIYLRSSIKDTKENMRQLREHEKKRNTTTTMERHSIEA